MNCGSLYYSPMYDIGIIPESSTDMRTKQGLRPQKIANNCNSNPCSCNNMYPVPSLYVNYGPGTPCATCPCLKFIQAP